MQEIYKNNKSNIIAIFIFVYMIFPVSFFAQGGLQFNQVLFLNSSALQTVPQGKVWKIEALLMPNEPFVKFNNQTGGSCGCDAGSGYSRDNYVTSYSASEFNGKNNVQIDGVNYVYTIGSSICWLHEGQTIAPLQLSTPVQYAHAGGSSCYAPYWIDGVYQNCSAYTPAVVTVTPVISIIEFTVVP
jgi:hypothetical protein